MRLDFSIDFCKSQILQDISCQGGWILKNLKWVEISFEAHNFNGETLRMRITLEQEHG
jgi:hypothetical protein